MNQAKKDEFFVESDSDYFSELGSEDRVRDSELSDEEQK